jgi:hypothetical protein
VLFFDLLNGKYLHAISQIFWRIKMSLARLNGWAQPTDSGNAQITGRTLKHYTVSLSNVHVNYASSESDFEKLIRAISQIGSIELLGTPAGGAFRVAISGAAPSASTGATSLQAYANTYTTGAGVVGTTVSDFNY